MAKKTERKKIEAKLDKAWSLAIRGRDDYTCVRCGKEGTQACHIVPRRHRILRWDWSNGVCMCYYCHNIWHSNPLEAAEWFEIKFPERWEYLHSRKNITAKWSMDELEEKLEELE